ncbi:hypothetical protein NL676_016122 [Syzygium grande]|nr:hypothetical protein NL676_016122 [Syzygium grande]
MKFCELRGVFSICVSRCLLLQIWISLVNEQRKKKRSSMADLRAIYGRATVHGHPTCSSHGFRSGVLSRPWMVP